MPQPYRIIKASIRNCSGMKMIIALECYVLQFTKTVDISITHHFNTPTESSNIGIIHKSRRLEKREDKKELTTYRS
jgi:hypothetical protein